MVEIQPYKPSWPEEFKQIAAHLRHHLGELALRIDHIGSTSVPGLAAKDLIDIQVTVVERKTAVLQAFQQAGYVKSRHESDHVPPGFDPNPRDWEKWLFKSPAHQREVNAHVRMLGRANQRYALLFRDYLRAFPKAAQAYAEVKTAIVAYHPEDDLTAYYDIKNPVCDIIYAGAELWAQTIQWEPS